MPFEDDNDNGVGLSEAMPWEVKVEIAKTTAAYQATNRDVENSQASKGFKEEWRRVNNDWVEYMTRHSGVTDLLRDEVYRRVIDYRKQSDNFRSALLKSGSTVTTQDSINKVAAAMTPPKNDVSSWSWGKVAAIGAGLVTFRWLWNKAGQDSAPVYMKEEEDDEY